MYRSGVDLNCSRLKSVLTDTGVRYTTEGQFALYTVGGYKALGLICEKCSGLTPRLKPWIRCGCCRKHLFEVVSTTQPSKILQVDQDRDVAVPAGIDDQSPSAITQIGQEAADTALVITPGPSAPVTPRG